MLLSQLRERDALQIEVFNNLKMAQAKTSMLASTLVTNEVKNAAGTEEEFERFSSDGRSAVYMKVNEVPAYPHRLTINHSESGTGVNRRRRSVVRIDKTVAGQIDTTVAMRGSVYIVGDFPVGNISTNALIADIIANLLSFSASLGANTTILYDGTGNGAKTLIAGSI